MCVRIFFSFSNSNRHALVLSAFCPPCCPAPLGFEATSERRSVESALTLDSQMANVIHVGINEAVLATRKTILKKAGHNVILARDLREVISACKAGSFDVGIIGQALPQMEKLRVSDTLRKHCTGIRILEFHDAIKPDLDTADVHLRVAETTPASFLDTVTQLASIRREKGKASQ